MIVKDMGGRGWLLALIKCLIFDLQWTFCALYHKFMLDFLKIYHTFVTSLGGDSMKWPFVTRKEHEARIKYEDWRIAKLSEQISLVNKNRPVGKKTAKPKAKKK